MIFARFVGLKPPRIAIRNTTTQVAIIFRDTTYGNVQAVSRAAIAPTTP